MNSAFKFYLILEIKIEHKLWTFQHTHTKWWERNGKCKANMIRILQKAVQWIIVISIEYDDYHYTRTYLYTKSSYQPIYNTHFQENALHHFSSITIHRLTIMVCLLVCAYATLSHVLLRWANILLSRNLRKRFHDFTIFETFKNKNARIYIYIHKAHIPVFKIQINKNHARFPIKIETRSSK